MKTIENINDRKLQEEEAFDLYETEDNAAVPENVMPFTLEEFLAEHPVSDETEQVTLCERLKSFDFKIGLMSKDQRNTYLNVCMIKDRKGRIVKQDMGKFNELVSINHCLYPNFQNLDFVRKCGCSTPSETLYKVLKVGEVEKLSQKIMEFNGFDDFEDLRKKAKNS